MNKEFIDDLKEFITVAISEQVAPILNVIDTRFDENEMKQNEILNVIGEIQDMQSKAIHRHADHLDDHERRITRLEKRAA